MKDFFDRYAHRIQRCGEDDCWPWIGGTTTAGYGHSHRNSKHFYSHRAAYECAHGEDTAKGFVVRHSCDNPPCCNPRHLLLGTNLDNCLDAWERGLMRPAQGERHGKAKLSEAQVLELRELHHNGAKISSLAREFCVRHGTVWAAIFGKSWRHI